MSSIVEKQLCQDVLRLDVGGGAIHDKNLCSLSACILSLDLINCAAF